MIFCQLAFGALKLLLCGIVVCLFLTLSFLKPREIAVSKAPLGPGDVQSIPEPTSGLMLLFGVAGLALKRKRA